MVKVIKRKKRGNRAIKPQEQAKHPVAWERDLNPHRLEGQNTDPRSRTAADIKDMTRRADFSLEELREIPIAPAGAPLKEGAVYFDLALPVFGPFVAAGGMKAEERHYYAPKAEVPQEYWNRLVKNLCPRTDEGEKSEVRPPPEPVIDQTGADSFPASDPPSWTMGREKDKDEREE